MPILRRTVLKTLLWMRQTPLRHPALKLLVRLHNASYHLIALFASHTGRHPKHDIQKYYEFFLQHIKSSDRVLDVGCGKAFLLYDLTQSVPGIEVAGIDISRYAIEHAKDEVKPHLQVGRASELPMNNDSFDLVYSINTLHNQTCDELEKSLREIERVGKQHKYICVESFRNEEEKVNLLYWQLTCESFYSPDEWQWWFDRCGYIGDHSFIYFE